MVVGHWISLTETITIMMREASESWCLMFLDLVPEHGVGGLWISMEVEFCGGCHIPDSLCAGGNIMFICKAIFSEFSRHIDPPDLHVAAHNVEAGEPGTEAGVGQQRDGEVGERTQGDQAQLPGPGQAQAGEHTDNTGVR